MTCVKYKSLIPRSLSLYKYFSTLPISDYISNLLSEQRALENFDLEVMVIYIAELCDSSVIYLTQ